MSHTSDGDAVDRMLSEIENLLKRQQGGAPVRNTADTTLEATMNEERTAQALDETDAVRPPHDGAEPPPVRDLTGTNDAEDAGETSTESTADDFGADASVEPATYDPDRVVREIRALRSREARADREVRADADNVGQPAQDPSSNDFAPADPSGNGAAAAAKAAAPSAVEDAVDRDVEAGPGDRPIDPGTESKPAHHDVSDAEGATARGVDFDPDVPDVSPRDITAADADVPEAAIPVRAADEAPAPPPPDARHDRARSDAGKERSPTPATTTPDSTRADGRAAAPADSHAANTEGHAPRELGDGIHMTRRLTTRLGRLLVDADMISERQLEAALRLQQETGDRLGSLLVNEGLIEESTLLFVLERQYGVPSVSLDEVELDTSLAKLIPHELARSSLIVPLGMRGDAVDVAMVDPTDFVAMAHIRVATGVRPNVFITTVNAARRAIARLYGKGPGPEPAEEQLAPREAIKRMILERDAVLLADDSDPRTFYQLAASIDRFVDEILRKADDRT